MKKNLIYSVLGVVFQTLFPLIVYPYITRVLGVSNLGEYNFYASTVSYLALFSGFGISLYGTKEIGKWKDDKAAYSKVFGELVTLNLIMSVIVYLLIIALIFLSPSYQNYKLFLITSITILANAIGAEYLFVALEKQKFMLIRNVVFKILSLVLIFLFVKDEGDLLVYALIMLLSTAGVSITNIINYRNKIEWGAIKIKEFHLAVYLLPLLQVFIMDALIHYYGMMDIVILGNMDTTESVGYYSVASKIYALSYSLLASTAVPLLPRAAYYVEHKMEGEYSTMVQKCYDIYLLIIAFSAFVLFFYAEDIIVLISGEEFRNGYVALRLFAPVLLLSSFCNFFIFEVFYPKNRNKFVLIGLFTSIVLNLVLSLFLIPLMSFTGAAIAFVISYVYLFLFFLIGGRGELPKFCGFNDLLKDTAGIVVCIAICMALRHTGLHVLIQLIVCTTLFVFFELLIKNKTAIYFQQLIWNKIKEIKVKNETKSAY